MTQAHIGAAMAWARLFTGRPEPARWASRWCRVDERHRRRGGNDGGCSAEASFARCSGEWRDWPHADIVTGVVDGRAMRADRVFQPPGRCEQPRPRRPRAGW